MIPSRVQKVGWRVALLLILLAAFALRLHELARQNIWWDEARNIDVALRPFTQIATAPELDIQPPFYFWLLHGWNNLAGMTSADPTLIAFWARFLSAAAGLVGTALLYQLGRVAFSPAAGAYTALISGLSPFWLAESQEARMYTVGFALLTGAAVMLLKEIRDVHAPQSNDWRLEIGDGIGSPNPQSPISNLRNLIAFVILSTLALLTHYNAVFILVAWYVWWAIWALMQPDRWRKLRVVIVCGLAMTVLIAPIAPIALRQIPTYANPNLVIPTLRDYLWQNWQAYLGGYAFDPALLGGYGIGWLWFGLGLLVGGLVLAIIPRAQQQEQALDPFPSGNAQPLPTPRAPSGPLPYTSYSLLPTPYSLLPTSIFLLVWLLGGLALYYIAVLDRGAFNVRYSSFVTPALYTLLGMALAGWGKWARPLAAIGLALLVVGMAPALRADLYDARFAREDVAGVTAWLRQTAGPDDLILVDQKYPFGFYYGRYTIDPAATPVGPEAAAARYLFVDINTLDQQLNAWAGNAQRVFWVQWFESDTDPRHAVRFLLDKAGQYQGEQGFQGYSVEWWALNPPTHFVLAPQLTPMQVFFPGAVETVAVSLPDQPLAPGSMLPVVIRWQRSAQTVANTAGRPLKARVALYDQNDARLAQSDERLLNDRHRAPVEWSMTEQPLNVYQLDLPAELTAGTYAVRLLVYDAETLEPIALADAAGNPAGVEATLGMVTVAGE